MKVERGIEAEVLQMKFYRITIARSLYLSQHRNIELHVQYGRHFKICISKFKRDFIFNPHTADIVTVGAFHEIYRLNLGLCKF